LIIIISKVSIATVTSVCADVITADRGIPFLSERICFLVPNLFLLSRAKNCHPGLHKYDFIDALK
jgi:hypothetical protein